MTGTGDHEDAATYGATAQAAIRRPGRWWGRKGTAAKVESYTRISFHLFPVAQLVTALLSLTPSRRAPRCRWRGRCSCTSSSASG